MYRRAVVEAQRSKWLGKIILVNRITFSALAGFAGVLAVLLLSFLLLGTYTKRTKVRGQLFPDIGLVKVHAPQSGVVVEKRVTEGQSVEQGDVLYVLSSERRTSTKGDTQATISAQFTQRENSLNGQLDKLAQLEQTELGALHTKARSFREEVEKIGALIAAQDRLTALAEDSVARYRTLASNGYVSKDQLVEKQQQLIDAHAKRAGLDRERIATRRDLSDVESQEREVPAKYHNQMAELHQSIAGAEADLTESEAKRLLLLVAPAAGVATAVIGTPGELVDSTKPLVSLVPMRARLQARLYAPSRAIGFVKRGDAVSMRFDAYPYQKFGHYRGTVALVSRVALTSEELTGIPLFGTKGDGGPEPVFLVVVDLESQFARAYGRPVALQSGMLLDADLMQEKKRLYEWALDPLYSVSGASW